MAFLKEIKSLDKRDLKSVDTVVTNCTGERHIEKINDSGETIVTDLKDDKGLGFCPDLQKDYNVGLVMPRLLVASSDVAYDLTHLRKHKVTHILNVAVSLPNAFTNEFVYFNVDMYDDLEEVIMNHYTACEQFIDESLCQESNVVLIHCNAGRSRSVSIAAVYLMKRKGMSMEEALTSIRKTRPNADPNPAFFAQLQQINKDISAKNL